MKTNKHTNTEEKEIRKRNARTRNRREKKEKKNRARERTTKRKIKYVKKNIYKGRRGEARVRKGMNVMSEEKIVGKEKDGNGLISNGCDD